MEPNALTMNDETSHKLNLANNNKDLITCHGYALQELP